MSSIRVEQLIDQFASEVAERLKHNVTKSIHQLIQRIGDPNTDMSGKVIRVWPDHCPDKHTLQLLADIYSVSEIKVQYHGDRDADYCGDGSHYTLHFGPTHTSAIAQMESQLAAMRERVQQKQFQL